MTKSPVQLVGRKLSPRASLSAAPDWQQADPRWIEMALQRALAKSTGGWFAVAASRRLPVGAPRALTLPVASREFVLWRDGGRVLAAVDRCPHLGASFSGAAVVSGCLICPWHGRAIKEEEAGWRPLPAFDDGVLLWLQLLAEGEVATAAPQLSARPARFLDAVMAQEASCEPADILANRLDPWHGAHYHRHSFAALRVVEQSAEEITVRVVYRVGPRLGVEVDARFHCPDARTITMTIVDGEGVGSVVETHATPLAPGRTLVLEAVLATSDRPQFWWTVRALGPLLRPLVERSARRLWVDDAAYAERRHRLRVSPADWAETAPR